MGKKPPSLKFCLNVMWLMLRFSERRNGAGNISWLFCMVSTACGSTQPKYHQSGPKIDFHRIDDLHMNFIWPSGNYLSTLLWPSLGGALEHNIKTPPLCPPALQEDHACWSTRWIFIHDNHLGVNVREGVAKLISKMALLKILTCSKKINKINDNHTKLISWTQGERVSTKMSAWEDTLQTGKIEIIHNNIHRRNSATNTHKFEQKQQLHSNCSAKLLFSSFYWYTHTHKTDVSLRIF